MPQLTDEKWKERVANTVLEKILKGLRPHGAAVLFRDGGELRVLASRGIKSSASLKRDRSVLGALHGKKSILGNKGCGSVLCSPLLDFNNNVEALFYAEVASGRLFQERELTWLDSLANKARKELFGFRADTLRWAARRVIDHIIKNLDPGRAVILHQKEEDAPLTVLAAYRLPEEDFGDEAEVSFALLERLWKRGKPAAIKDAHESAFAKLPGIIEHQVRSVAACPVHDEEGSMRGLIYVDDRREVAKFRARELNLLVQLASKLTKVFTSHSSSTTQLESTAAISEENWSAILESISQTPTSEPTQGWEVLLQSLSEQGEGEDSPRDEPKKSMELNAFIPKMPIPGVLMPRGEGEPSATESGEPGEEALGQQEPSTQEALLSEPPKPSATLVGPAVESEPEVATREQVAVAQASQLVGRLDQALEAAEEEVAAAEVEVDTAEEEVAAAEVEVDTAEEEVAAAEVEVDTAEEEVAAAEVEVDTAEEEVAAAEVEVDTAEEEVAAAEVEVDTAEEEVAAAEVEVNTAEVEVAAAEVEVDTAEEEVATAEEEVATAEEELATVEEELATVEEELATVEEELATVEEEVAATELVVHEPETGAQASLLGAQDVATRNAGLDLAVSGMQQAWPDDSAETDSQPEPGPKDWPAAQSESWPGEDAEEPEDATWPLSESDQEKSGSEGTWPVATVEEAKSVEKLEPPPAKPRGLLKMIYTDKLSRRKDLRSYSPLKRNKKRPPKDQERPTEKEAGPELSSLEPPPVFEALNNFDLRVAKAKRKGPSGRVEPLKSRTGEDRSESAATSWAALLETADSGEEMGAQRQDESRAEELEVAEEPRADELDLAQEVVEDEAEVQEPDFEVAEDVIEEPQAEELEVAESVEEEPQPELEVAEEVIEEPQAEELEVAAGAIEEPQVEELEVAEEVIEEPQVEELEVAEEAIEEPQIEELEVAEEAIEELQVEELEVAEGAIEEPQVEELEVAEEAIEEPQIEELEVAEEAIEEPQVEELEVAEEAIEEPQIEELEVAREVVEEEPAVARGFDEVAPAMAALETEPDDYVLLEEEEPVGEPTMEDLPAVVPASYPTLPPPSQPKLTLWQTLLKWLGLYTPKPVDQMQVTVLGRVNLNAPPPPGSDFTQVTMIFPDANTRVVKELPGVEGTYDFYGSLKCEGDPRLVIEFRRAGFHPVRISFVPFQDGVAQVVGITLLKVTERSTSSPLLD